MTILAHFQSSKSPCRERAKGHLLAGQVNPRTWEPSTEVARCLSSAPQSVTLSTSIVEPGYSPLPPKRRCVIPKSTTEWQIRESIEADSIELTEEVMKDLATMDRKARFNDPSTDFGYNL